MTLSKCNFVLFLLTIGYIGQVTSQCASPFSLGDVTNFCYQYKKTSSSWSDAYNQCLSKSIDGILIQSSSTDQFNALKKANIDRTTPFWLGANNFASFRDSKWHWLDGSIVDNSVVPWCPNSTYDTAIGTYCAAYDSTSNCVNNYLCSTLLPAPCVAKTSEVTKQEKLILSAQKAITSVCTNSYAGAYANWWTYSILLLNWFILLCFILYLTYHFMINKCTVIINVITIILSFMTIIVFAILWGIQYQDIILIPLLIVIIGCIASLLLLIDVLILISNRNRIQRSMACMIVTIVTIIIESILMLGLILCIAYCSAYISLVSTILDKDIIASLLAAVIAAISVLFYTAILYLIGNTGQDRPQVVRPMNQNPILMTTTQTLVSRPAHSINNGVDSKVAAKKCEQVERATSPVDERIINEFYSDQPRDIHQYNLEGRQYVVFEGKTLTNIEVYRRDLTQAMLSQEPGGLHQAIDRAKASIHASALTDEIHQAEDLVRKL